MTLADEDLENGLQLVTGSHGMNVPSACTIVIIAGSILIHIIKQDEVFLLRQHDEVCSERGLRKS